MACTRSFRISPTPARRRRACDRARQEPVSGSDRRWAAESIWLVPLAGQDFRAPVFPAFYERPNYIFDSTGTPLQFGPNGDLVPYGLGTIVSTRGLRHSDAILRRRRLQPGAAILRCSRRRALPAQRLGHYDYQRGRTCGHGGFVCAQQRSGAERFLSRCGARRVVQGRADVLRRQSVPRAAGA